MSDARSKLDIIYQDVLGDINDVINRVDSLKTDIPNAVASASGIIFAASTTLNNTLSTIEKKVDDYTDSAAKKAISSHEKEIQTAIAESISNTLTKEIGAALSPIKKAAQNLKEETQYAVDSIRSASHEHIGWKWMLAMTFGISLLGGLTPLLVFQYTGTTYNATSSLSDADSQALYNGREIVKIWPHLSKKEQDRINDLVLSEKNGKLRGFNCLKN